MENLNLFINVVSEIVIFVCGIIFYLLVVRNSEDFANTGFIEENVLKIGLGTVIVFSGYSIARPHSCSWSYTFLSVGWAIIMFYAAYHFYQKYKATDNGN